MRRMLVLLGVSLVLLLAVVSASVPVVVLEHEPVPIVNASQINFTDDLLVSGNVTADHFYSEGGSTSRPGYSWVDSPNSGRLHTGGSNFIEKADGTTVWTFSDLWFTLFVDFRTYGESIFTGDALFQDDVDMIRTVDVTGNLTYKTLLCDENQNICFGDGWRMNHTSDENTYMYFRNDMSAFSYGHGLFNAVAKDRIAYRARVNATGALPAVGLWLEAHSNKPGAGGALGLPAYFISNTYDDSAARGSIYAPDAISGATGSLPGHTIAYGFGTSSGSNNSMHLTSIDETYGVVLSKNEELEVHKVDFGKVTIFDTDGNTSYEPRGFVCGGTVATLAGSASPQCFHDDSGSNNYADKFTMGDSFTVGRGDAQINITMTSPDASEWCCGVNDSGIFLCKGGSC